MWIVTFTDMISLLLTFFIMLLTFSSMEDEQFQQASGSLSGAFGVITKLRQRSKPDVATSTPQRRDTDRDGPRDPSIRKATDDAVKKIQNRKIFNVEISAEDTVEGTRIKITPKRGAEIFDLGTDRLTTWARQSIEEIGAMFKTLAVRLVVEAHIDDRIWRARRGQTALDLTLEMALSAAAVLEDAGLAPERVGVSPRAALFPVGDNEVADGRYENRRLEILVIPHAKDEAWKSVGRGN